MSKLHLVGEKSNIIPIGGDTILDIPVERVTRAAEENCIHIVIFGYDKEGNEYFASSFTDIHKTLLLIERFKLKLLSGDFGDVCKEID